MVRLWSMILCWNGRCARSAADMTRIGSGSLPASKEYGRIFRRNEIVKTLSASALNRARNLIERFFNKIRQYQRVATRYDKLAANYLAFIKLASIRIWLRAYEFKLLAIPELLLKDANLCTDRRLVGNQSVSALNDTPCSENLGKGFWQARCPISYIHKTAFKWQ